ncbi:unnamed protein product [Diamesa hyperborea]
MDHYSLSIALKRFKDDFFEDFNIRDVQKELRVILLKNELLEILQETTEESKIEKLFFTFIYVKKNVVPFVNILKNSYRWLYNSLTNSQNDKWIEDYRRAIQDIPNNQDGNIHRCQYLWKIQKILNGLERSKYLIIHGKLGFGKRWIASDACRDFSIIRKMNFKIYWLNVSKCTSLEAMLEKMRRLKVLLQADDTDIKYNTYTGNTKNEIIHMKNHLRRILETSAYKDCLIVLSDVQNENTIKSLNLNCKVLITTQNLSILESIPKDSQFTVEINNGLTENETKELFSEVLNRRSLSKRMLSNVERFHEFSYGHPFILSLIAKNFMEFANENEKRQEERGNNWLKNLESYKLQEQQIQIPIEESLKQLDVKYQEYYKKLVVFTDNVDIPYQVLSKYWQTDSRETEEIVLKLQKYSLLENNVDEHICSMHYLYYNYLLANVPKVVQKMYHRNMIENYNIEKIFDPQNRKELDLEFADDNYMHYFIGYHFLGADMLHLFQLYLDFGFLEQKIRITKLPNTIGDLKKFKMNIIHSFNDRNVDKRRKLLESLLEFLPSVEDGIFKAMDTSLLQCALSSTGLIRDEARRQCENFTDRVWLYDIDHYENQTQIVELADKSHPCIVKFVKADEGLFCLIVLDNNNILLHDIAPDYLNVPQLFLNDHPQSDIHTLEVFRNEAFMTLNVTGKLCIYSLKNVKYQNRRLSGPQKLRLSKDKLLQRVEDHNDKITCFCVDGHQQSTTVIDLICGTANGSVKFFKWNSIALRFDEDKKRNIKTGFGSLFKIAHIQPYIMLLNVEGYICFYNLINSGMLPMITKWERLNAPINLHQAMCSQEKLPISICVSKDKVVQITHEMGDNVGKYVKFSYEDIYMEDDSEDNQILSSTLSRDAKIFIIGTRKGIVVLDRIKKVELFRRNVSEKVMSLDIYRYPDEVDYYMASVFKDSGNVISLHAINGNRDEWALMNNKMGNNILAGEDLFDIKMEESNGGWSMIAVDRSRPNPNIDHRSSKDEFSISLHKTSYEYQIKKICYAQKDIYVGCTNGSVFKVGHVEPVLMMSSEITYMENINDSFVIVSSNNSYKIIGLDFDFYGKLFKCFHLIGDLLLIVKEDCNIELINVQTGVKTSERVLAANSTCAAVSFHDSMLTLATTQNVVIIYNISFDRDTWDDDEDDIKLVQKMDYSVTALSISPDKNVLAVGYLNGIIELYELPQMTMIQQLEAHKRQIWHLEFSPWQETKGPLILLSLSESLIFWNCSYVQNNRSHFKRVRTPNVRVSQRFRSPMNKSSSPGSDHFHTAMKALHLTSNNPWQNKIGSTDKRELLSCIKFVGKYAKKVFCNNDFTHFITIDNEGNIYYLRLVEDSQMTSISIDFNGNPYSVNT